MKRYTVVGSEDPRLPGLIDADTVGAGLGISREEVYKLARNGELRSVWIGSRAVRFHPDDIAAFIEERRKHGRVDK